MPLLHKLFSNAANKISAALNDHTSLCTLYNTNDCTNKYVLSASNGSLIDLISLKKWLALVFSTNPLNCSFVDLEQVKQHLNNLMNINSQFTISLAQDVASPKELFAITLYSPASSAEHLQRKKTKWDSRQLLLWVFFG